MSYRRRYLNNKISTSITYHNGVNNDKENDESNQKQILVKKMESFLNLKDYCRTGTEKLFNEFIADFNLIINQLKENARNKYDDYISHPKTKLRNNNDEVNDALKSLENELKEIIKRDTKNIEVKFQNLRAKITVIVHKINEYLFETKAQFKKVYLSGNVEEDKMLRLDDLAEPLAIGLGIAGGSIGAIIGIGIAQGVAEGIGGGLLLGGAFGFISAGIGVIIGLVGFGIYNLYKATHKEEDLVELAKKSKNKFFENIGNYVNKVETQLEKYKEEVINELIVYIEKQVSKFQLAMDEFEHPDKHQMSQNNYYFNNYSYNIMNKNKN